MQNEYKNDIPKYKKKMKSDTSKSNRKSKHKHHYEECLIQYNFKYINENILITSLHSYCTICGKIYDRFKEDKSIVKDFIRNEELYEKYHDKMSVFFVEDIYKEKYVDLKQLMLNDESNGE